MATPAPIPALPALSRSLEAVLCTPTIGENLASQMAYAIARCRKAHRLAAVIGHTLDHHVVSSIEQVVLQFEAQAPLALDLVSTVLAIQPSGSVRTLGPTFQALQERELEQLAYAIDQFCAAEALHTLQKSICR